MDITCSAEPCPIVLNSTCVFYEGDNLIYTGINNNDNLQTALQKIDQKFQDAGLGYIFSNGIEQLVPGGAVMLGGALNKNTTIGGLYNLAFAGTLEASALITTGGSSTDFVKGDGSLDPTNYQPAGNYISNLTGDVIANGPGSVAATLATVFGAPGTYGNSGNVPSITVDGKGRITNVTPIPINYPAQPLSFVGDVEGAGFTGSPVTLTLDTVNTDIYGSNNFLKFAVNGKGLITSATPVSGGDITTALGYVPVNDAIELTINGVAHDLTANRDWNVGTVTTVGVTVGTGISASVSNPNTNPVINIINTAPDQTVNLNAGFGISISGSYPNFTITNDYPDLPNEGVTSVSAGNLSPLFTTSVTDPTTTPALSFALSSAAANTVFAGPDGGAGAPTYRALVAADIPSLAYISSISTTAPLATTGGLTPTLSISQANASTDGYLSSIDWNTFNNKEDALGYTPVPDTRQLNINGVDYDLTADRCWSVGTVTSITASAPLTGGTITGSGSVGITQASGGTDGYLSATDWSTFNGKQPAGSYITDLTGDATASGPGSACLTLASVNLATGTFGSSTQVPVITVNNKGLVTCVTTDTISGSLEFIGDVTGVGSTGTCTSLTLATVNTDVHTSETLLNIAVNGKGLITSANPTTAGDICSTLGYTPEDVANKSTATSLGVSNTLYPTQLAVKTYVDSATAGGIILQGSWDASTNTPDISGTTTTGWAWRVDVAGTTNLGGINDWQVGDLAVKSATGWVKIDNTENVTSVFGRFGTVIATTGDYLTCQVTECGDLYYTDARVRAAVGHTAPLTYCSTTGVFGISQSNATTDGYLSSVDWNTFNDKQPLISCGTIGQYYRGDKTFQTLDTLAVPENTNLYFTDGRARSAICASSGVAYNPSTGLITNSCPDQIVSLTGGGTTSIAGTYPNFCITSNDCFTGTVTSVAVSGTNIGVTGSPITTCGTIGLSLSAANVCSALGFSPYNSTNPAGYTTCTGTVTNVAACTSTTGVSITGSPITSSGTLGINVSTASSVCTGLLTAADWNTFNSHTGCTGTVTSVGLTSSTAGVSIACSPVTSSGTISLNITTASSLCTGLLTASDWNSFNSRTSCTGTVTCVNATGTNISVTGGPITTSGTIGISLSGANVCSALGYTPYNASNPNGYTTCIGTVTSAGIVATNINVCNSPVTTSGNICLNLTGANVCSALGYSPVQPNGTGATGTWPISITGSASSATNSTNTSNISLTGLGNGSMNVSNGASAVYRNENGNGGNLAYAPVLHLGGGDTMWQIQGDYYNSSTLQWRAGYAGSWYAWRTILHDANYNSYAPTLTGGGASGTWGINITGSAGSAGSSSSVSASSSTGITSSYSTTINTTTPGTATYGMNFIGSSTADNASGITWSWSGNAAQAGIYVQSSGSYGTKMYFATTDSFATGAKTGMSMDHNGTVLVTRSYLQSDSSLRAPIFYDSNDTTYYGDFASTSRIRSLNMGYVGGQVYLNSDGGTLFFNANGESDIQGYSIGTTMENYGGNYTKLTIDWHTGIRIGAASGYGGIRFYNNSVKYYSGSQVFSVAEGDNNVRVTNTLITGSMTYSGAITYTGGAGSTALNLATNDGYASMRVIRNNMSGAPFNDGMYIGYQNASSGITRIFGGGSTSGGISVNGGGVNDVLIAGNVVLNAGNYNSYSPTLTGGGASGTWGISITGSAGSAARAFYSLDGFYNNGGHGSSWIQNELPAAQNGASTGRVVLRQWCSEPGVTWDWAGFGYNVLNDGGSPNGFGRFNGNFGQAYMRFATNGDWYFYNTTVGGTRTTSMSLSSTGAANFGGTISNGSVWINNGANSNSYNENIRLFNAPNGVSVIAFSASGESGMPTTSILGYSDRMEFRYGNGAQFRIYDGYTVSMGSSRAPIFYDSDDTGYYADFNSTSNSAMRVRGGTLYGPNPSWGRYLQVGGNGNQNTDYASVVTTDGNLHLDARAGSAMYLNYYANGIIYLNGASYYISSNGSFYNGRSANSDALGGYASGTYIGKFGNGNGYYQVDNWIQVNNSTGIFWPSYYSFHIRPNISVSHTQMEIIGSKNGYGGIYDNFSAVNGFMYDSGGNGGVYREANGRWYFYYHLGNNSMGIGSSANSSSYVLYASGNIYATGDIVAYSDRRKKTNIVTIENALDTVGKMRGVFYDKIGEEEKGRQLGVIAQEVNEVLPEAVTYAQDVDEYGVKYGNLGGLFIEAFKEQQKRIEAQDKVIEELKTIISGITK